MNDETQVSPRPPVPTEPGTASQADTAPGHSAPSQQAEALAETLAQTPGDVARTTSVFAPPSHTTACAVPGYEILSELGRGGMGVVYKARQVKLNRVVALKMVLSPQHADPREVRRFLLEAEAVAAIRHPNVIQIYDSGEVQGRPFMAMECLEGGSLVA